MLVADGGTDRMLVPIIRWAIHRLDPEVDILEPEFRKRKGSIATYLSELSTGAMLVFVHRDAETASLGNRLSEFTGVSRNDVVPVIPVRMSEAWLLFDGPAIARAAGASAANVSVPSPSQIEAVSNPKQLLSDLLRQAAGSPTGRRKDQLDRDLTNRRVGVAREIHDFSPLETLPAFRQFQEALEEHYPYLESSS